MEFTIPLTKIALLSSAVLAALSLVGANQRTANQTPRPPLSPSVQASLSSITPANLKGDLSFLASDALQGRFTPSPGLDVAAEFIAARFRASGLEPAGDQGYFQTAHMIDRRMRDITTDLTFRAGTETKLIPSRSFRLLQGSEAQTISNAPVMIVRDKDPAVLKEIDLTGKVILVAPQDGQNVRGGQGQRSHAFDRAVQASQVALELIIEAEAEAPPPLRLLTAEQAPQHRVPVIAGDNADLRKLIDSPETAANLRLSIDIPAPDDKQVVLKNVVGLLRGSDPNLKSTCVLLTAHYDHIGTTDTGAALSPQHEKPEDDHIYNGANDDGSGTVSVIEIGRALSLLKTRPKRSVLFVTFFGEERGEFGSKFYGTHPIFPIADTVADLNLEQVGRTDSTTGPQVNRASLTGFDYSDLTKYLTNAGERTGIKLYLDSEASDEYFTRSDNDALAQQGVPAHTLCVAFDYPDYHGLKDEWEKIDYDNMARVDRMVALALINLANSEKRPAWNAQNEKTKLFRDAQQRQHLGEQKTEPSRIYKR